MKIAMVVLCFTFLVGVSKSENVYVVQELTVSPDVRIVVTSKGKGVRGANVDFYQTEYVPGRPGNQRLVLRVSLLTNEYGMTTPNRLALGDYEVKASHDEDTSEPVWLHVFEEGGNSTAEIRLNSEEVPKIPADLPAGAQLRSFNGTVTDMTEAVIPGARIRVVKRVKGYPDVMHVKADASGRFSGELQQGSYIAIFFARGFHTELVPFVVTKQGSGNLRVQLQISDLPTT